MNIKLQKSKIVNPDEVITITGSKSESNRLLLLQALYPEISIENLSNSDDTQFMSKALSSVSETIDVHHAGTAMRFLSAFFATQEEREIILTGSQRMKERPIQLLVEALNQLGADISYVENHGLPPLKIKGKRLENSKVTLKANVSSQYISALLLIAPKLKNGLELTLEGTITSLPYIKMTLSLLNEVGVETSFKDGIINVQPKTEIEPHRILVESDWSSVSYFYSLVALNAIGTQVEIAAYKQNSLQGDSVLSEIYKTFGVETTFNHGSIVLNKTANVSSGSSIELDLSNAPDIAQTIAVTCLGLGLSSYLTGLHTLKIKETDRLVALKTELEKLGATVTITDKTLHLKACDYINDDVLISTYNDHRMAMAFAPLALKVPIAIEDAEVVSKSYPNFWKDMKTLGIQLNE